MIKTQLVNLEQLPCWFSSHFVNRGVFDLYEFWFWRY